MTIDNIVFGNPTQQDYMQIKKQSIIDDLFHDLRKFTPPANSSEGTKQELNEIMTAMSSIDGKSEQFEIWDMMDKSMVPYIKNKFIAHGADAVQIHSLLDNIVADVLPLLTRLKYEFNRPRPSQLAYYYRLKLMPYLSNFAHSSPSYPSGHTVICAVITSVLCKHYPQAEESLGKGLKDLSYSRIALGTHYPSDNDFAITVADKIIYHKSFINKYKLNS